MNNNLDKIEQSLEKLHLDFNRQLEALGNDTKEFHKALISLSAKYPDHIELLQFVVFINDKLETNHTIFSDIIIESFNNLFNIKLLMIQEIRKANAETVKPTIMNKLSNPANLLKDFKLVVISLAIIIVSVSAIFAPAALVKVFSIFGGIIK